MELRAVIEHKIYVWPSLYKKRDYEQSRIAMLNKIFFSNYPSRWNPDGYMDELGDDMDIPEGFRLPEDFFPEPEPEQETPVPIEAPEKMLALMSAYGMNPEQCQRIIQLGVISKENKRSELRKILMSDERILYPSTGLDVLEAIYDEKIVPLPDWMEGAVEIVRWAKDAMSEENEENLLTHPYSPNSRMGHSKKWYNEAKEKGRTAFAKYRKEHGYKKGETLEQHCKRSWKEFLQSQREFFDKFLEKFDQ